MSAYPCRGAAEVSTMAPNLRGGGGAEGVDDGAPPPPGTAAEGGPSDQDTAAGNMQLINN